MSATSKIVTAGIVVIFWVWAYLDGPASFVVVSGQRVEVGNMYRRYSVPRSLVTGFEAEELGLNLVVRGLPPIRVNAVVPPLSLASSGSGRRYVVRANQLNAALAETTSSEPAGTVDRRVRLINVLLTFVPLGLVVLFFIAKPQ